MRSKIQEFPIIRLAVFYFIHLFVFVANSVRTKSNKGVVARPNEMLEYSRMWIKIPHISLLRLLTKMKLWACFSKKDDKFKDDIFIWIVQRGFTSTFTRALQRQYINMYQKKWLVGNNHSANENNLFSHYQ